MKKPVAVVREGSLGPACAEGREWGNPNGAQTRRPEKEKFTGNDHPSTLKGGRGVKGEDINFTA